MDCLREIDCFSESSSSSEDQDYGANACSILSSLEETIGRIDDLLSFDRMFVQGDIVCLVKDPSGQRGRVVNVDMVVDLENILGSKTRGVNSKNLQKICSIAVGDYVVNGPWLGKVEEVFHRVTVVYDDGVISEFTTRGPEIFTPVSPHLLEDPLYPFYPGQRVKPHARFVPKSTNWLCGGRNDKRHMGTVCSVDAGAVYVDWLGCVTKDDENLSNPPHLQDSKNLTSLTCFSDAKWQFGDWCLLPVADYENSQHTSLSPVGNEQHCKEVVVIVRTKAKVDVLWQDGSTTFGLDANSLFPVNVDSHDFWPNQFVVRKEACDDSKFSSLDRWGVVKCLDAKERTVRVKWTTFDSKETVEETVSAYELMDHPDYSYCLGDAVFRLHVDKPVGLIMDINGEMDQNKFPCIDYSSSIGIIVGFQDGNIKVKWATGATGMVAPYEIHCIDKYEDSSPAFIHSENIEQPNVDFDGNGEICQWKKLLATGSSCFSQAAIGLFSNLFSSLGTSLFGGYCHIPQDEKTPETLGGETLLHVTLNSDRDSKKSEKVTEEAEAELKRDGLLSTSSNLPPEGFSQFDMVNGCSDHHFVGNTGKGVPSSLVKRGWMKRVQEEWNILEHDLPEAIYVRVYEERTDLLRAAIVGSPGTPYHDGLFFFDICFPPEFPHEPPMVYYNSGGLRVNPNLYESGKVCLSLLNTWTGSGSEVWSPKCSTILQVLISLQALVLNEKPYFNEAGYDTLIGKADGEKNSVNYNENAFLVTCKSMLYLLRKPPMHFEALVKEHFSRRGEHILLACRSYMDGAPVGEVASGHLKSDQEQINRSSEGFKIMLAKIFPRLAEAFSDHGICSSQILDSSE